MRIPRPFGLRLVALPEVPDTPGIHSYSAGRRSEWSTSKRFSTRSATARGLRVRSPVRISRADPRKRLKWWSCREIIAGRPRTQDDASRSIARALGLLDLWRAQVFFHRDFKIHQ